MANFILPCDPNDLTHVDADNRRREETRISAKATTT